ncbi:hypothetical protein Tco_1351379 [Tanacetum coccineum]
MAAIHDSPTPNPTINFRGCLLQPKPPQSGVRFGQPPYKGGCFGGQPPRRSRLGFGGDTTTSRGVDLFCYITHKEGLVLKFAPKRVRCFGISKSRRGAVWLGWTTGEGVRGWFGAATTLREDRPEVTLPPWKRLGIALGPRYEVGESSPDTAARPDGGLRADYSFVATLDREIKHDSEREVGYGITDS